MSLWELADALTTPSNASLLSSKYQDVVFFGCALEGRSQGGQVVVCLYQVVSIPIEAEELEGGGDAVGEEGFEGGVVLGEVYNESFISGILIFSELIDFTKFLYFDSSSKKLPL
jgi:hypothetical protein